MQPLHPKEEISKRVLRKYEICKKIGTLPVLLLYPVGKGAYGVVWKAVDKRTRKTVALKKVMGAFRNDKDAQKTYREIFYLDQLNGHDNIMRLVEVMKDENNMDLYMVFEYLDSDLHAVIRAGIIEERHLQYITYQILRSLKYMHSGNVVHRDLKPSNILINPDCQVKLADFGHARSVKPSKKGADVTLTRDVATRWYSAPEILLGSKSYGKPADMWAVGCLLGEMLIGKPIFRGSSTIDQVVKIIAITGMPTEDDIKAMKCPVSLQALELLPHASPMNLRTLCPTKIEEAFDLLKEMLILNPEKRLAVDGALNHPFVSHFHAIIKEEMLHLDVVPDINDDTLEKAEEYRKAIYMYIATKKKVEKTSGDETLSKLRHLRYLY